MASFTIKSKNSAQTFLLRSFSLSILRLLLYTETFNANVGTKSRLFDVFQGPLLQPPDVFPCNRVTWFNSLKINRKPCLAEPDTICKLPRAQVSLSLKLMRYKWDTFVVMRNNRHIRVVAKFMRSWDPFELHFMPWVPIPGTLLGQAGSGSLSSWAHFLSEMPPGIRVHEKSPKSIDPQDIY